MSVVWLFLLLLMLAFAFGGYIFDFMEPSELVGSKSESSVFKSVLGALLFLVLFIHELICYFKNEDTSKT